jgi:hypothetical protein
LPSVVTGFVSLASRLSRRAHDEIAPRVPGKVTAGCTTRGSGILTVGLTEPAEEKPEGRTKNQTDGERQEHHGHLQ